MYLLSKLTSLLPVKLQPYAKAVVPTILGLSAIAGSWIATGEFNEGEVRALIGSGIYGLVVYGVENRDPVVPEA